MLNPRQLGESKESLACRFLQKQGLQLLERNYSCYQGEIDLIMISPSDELVFVEVRYRSHNSFGSAVESVTYSKRLRIHRTASRYLQMRPNMSKRMCRFDIVGISPADKSGKNSFQWVQNAFS